MCTAATYKTDGFYFGRTLDYEFSYGDEIVVTPRRFPLAFSGGKALSEHFALLGMAHRQRRLRRAARRRGRRRAV